MKIRIILFFLLFFGFYANSQVNIDFVNYLVQSDFQAEHKTYLDSLESKYGKTDSISFFRTKFLLFQNQYDSFQKEYNKCKLCFTDSLFLNYSSSHLIKSSIARADLFWTSDSLYGLNKSQNSILKKSYRLSLNPKIDASFLPNELSLHFNEYKKAYYKKAWVAGLMSALIPASGKLYVGRDNSFLGSLLLNVAHGIIAYEAINKKGISNPYSIVSTSIFGVFYLSNIFGSAHDLKRVKNEKRKHFLYEVANYQSTDLYLYE